MLVSDKSERDLNLDSDESYESNGVKKLSECVNRSCASHMLCEYRNSNDASSDSVIDDWCFKMKARICSS